MVPFLWLGVEPLLAGKLAMLISGAVFFHGSLFLVRSVGLRSIDELIVAWVLALTIPGWMSNHVDAGLIGRGVDGVCAWPSGVTGLAGESPAGVWHRRDLGFGLLGQGGGTTGGRGGECAAGRCAGGLAKQKTGRRLGGNWAVSLGLLALVAAPWITVLSLKYDKPTFSTSGPIAHAIVGPGNDRPAPHPFGSTIYQPEPGRVTAWEDPSRMGYDYWSPFASGENFSHQLSLIGRNAKTVFQFLAVFDGIGALLGWFGVGTLVFGLALFAKRPWAEKLAGRSLAMDGHPADLPRRYLPASLRHASRSALFLFVPAADHDSHAWPRFTILREQLADWLCFVVAFPVAAIVAFAIKITCWLIRARLGQADGKCGKWLGQSSAHVCFHRRAIGLVCTSLGTSANLGLAMSGQLR